ncbi:MAG: replication-associated recombination protein A [Planctomycetes bacterium]|nr:replication-associated recombination protein A [Planctomycetota bacterium]
MPDLFGEEERPATPITDAPKDAPLADRMRPRTITEYVGQRQLLGEGKILERMIRAGEYQSLVLWGPPGCGKTTLARLVADASEMRFAPFSAVLSGIKEVRALMREAEEVRAKTGERTLLFVDEIHRFNKAQQDAFLPFVERGDILLVGATTENPSFEIISALLSRLRVLILEPLSVEDLVSVLRRALEDTERGLAAKVTADDDVLRAVAHATDGDARRALTALETAASLLDEGAALTAELLPDALQRKVLHYDKTGEEHYNLISALHKSVRNSDVDAALYWVTRMMEAGEDGNYIARRLIRMALEDIGLADARALRVALDCADAYHRLGEPEGRLALAQAAVFLAQAKKSNAIYVALGQAEADVQGTSADPVPLHLRNASTSLMREAGYGEGYRYAHTDPDAVNEMRCMPDSLEGRRYFNREE